MTLSGLFQLRPFVRWRRFRRPRSAILCPCSLTGLKSPRSERSGTRPRAHMVTKPVAINNTIVRRLIFTSHEKELHIRMGLEKLNSVARLSPFRAAVVRSSNDFDLSTDNTYPKCLTRHTLSE